MNEKAPWSRLQGFYKLSPHERRQALLKLPLDLKDEDFVGIDSALELSVADLLSENVVGSFSLPFSVAVNMVVDQEPVLVPMVTEEPSIVAAVSNMAKVVSFAGGFKTKIALPIMKGQLQLYGFYDGDRIIEKLKAEKQSLIQFLNDHIPTMKARGGGVIELDWRAIKSSLGPMIIVEAWVDVRDAMGANIVNTLMEMLKDKLSCSLEAKIGLAILSNLCDQRIATAQCEIPFKVLSREGSDEKGKEIAELMLVAHAFAEADIYRACTHNKGILNGIDALALATGNDFRAIEAGAHAYAARSGTYSPLTRFSISNRSLLAKLSLPLAVGVVGGSTRIHKGVRAAHKILGAFSQSGTKLCSLMVSVGLVQCMAALRALSSEGIQKGHMKLHNKKFKDSK